MLRKARDLMKRFLLALPIFCAACSGNLVQDASVVTSDISTGIAAACTDVAATAKLFPKSPVLVYAEASCPLGQAAASLVQNAATIQWLGQINAQLQQPAAAKS